MANDKEGCGQHCPDDSFPVPCATCDRSHMNKPPKVLPTSKECRQYEINCAMGNIINSHANLRYWFNTDQDEDMRQTLSQLKAGVARLEKAMDMPH